MDKKKKIIYVADDDKAIVDALKLMLEGAGYCVDCAYDDTVIEKIRKRAPDLLLLDIWMSGVDGTDICRKIKENAATRDIPVIMLSANPDTPKVSKECGADDYVTKPFDVGFLLNKIESNI